MTQRINNIAQKIAPVIRSTISNLTKNTAARVGAVFGASLTAGTGIQMATLTSLSDKNLQPMRVLPIRK